MRVEKVHCVRRSCTLYGEGTVTVSVDYVYAYVPVHVRYSPNSLTVDFGTSVNCERFSDDERGISYLVCAPVVKDHSLEDDEFGLPAVIDLEEVVS